MDKKAYSVHCCFLSGKKDEILHLVGRMNFFRVDQ